MSAGKALPAGRLRLLALHSFRTSAKTFQEQVRRSGLDRKLEHLIELVYLDAPHAATGPPPRDVAPFFDPPYREWWNAEQNAETKEYVYDGGEGSLEYVEKFIQEQGPFHGFWAFSQGSILATLLISLICQGRFPNAEMQELPRFCVLFGGFFDKEKMKTNKMAIQILGNDVPMQFPSMHIIGERDALRRYSLMLAEKYSDPIVIMHPRGHVIPALDDTSYAKLEEFLEDQLLHHDSAHTGPGGREAGSRL